MMAMEDREKRLVLGGRGVVFALMEKEIVMWVMND